MGKTRNLKGIPNSLEQRYFSGLFYYGNGYMADYIWNSAVEENIKEIEIDILNNSVTPTCLQIQPIIAYLDDLKITINKTLKSNNFSEDFIVDARFKIFISQKYKSLRLFTCQGFVTDKFGKVYTGKIYTEKAYTVFSKREPISLFAKLKKFLIAKKAGA